MSLDAAVARSDLDNGLIWCWCIVDCLYSVARACHSTSASSTHSTGPCCEQLRDSCVCGTQLSLSSTSGFPPSATTSCRWRASGFGCCSAASAAARPMRPSRSTRCRTCSASGSAGAISGRACRAASAATRSSSRESGTRTWTRSSRRCSSGRRRCSRGYPSN
eukprot:scaffold3711_cov65-Phaeocystis_antarctica.AAC.2